MGYTVFGVPPPETSAAKPVEGRAPEVSVERQKKKGVQTLKVAVLAADGYDHEALDETRKALDEEGASTVVVSKVLGTLKGAGGETQVDKSHVTTTSVVYDAVLIPGGEHVKALRQEGEVMHFIREAYKHGKPIGATGEAVQLQREARLPGVQLADSAEAVSSQGVVSVAGAETRADRVKGLAGMTEKTGIGGFRTLFLEALAEHRHWGRGQSETIPA